MKKFSKSTLMRLLVLLLVFGLMAGCFAGCGDPEPAEEDEPKTTTSQKEPTDTSGEEPTDASEDDPTDVSEDDPTDVSEEEPTDGSEEAPTDATTEPPVVEPAPMVVTFNGLSITLNDSFELVDEEDERLIYSGDGTNVVVTFKPLRDWGNGATTSAEFAAWYQNTIDAEDYDYVLSKEADGISYLVCARTTGTVVYGFYISGLAGWMVKASGTEREIVTAIAAGGIIDEDKIPYIPNPITLKVWMPHEAQLEGNNWLATMQTQFEAEHPEWDIIWVNETLSVGDAAGVVMADVTASADVYMYANDQLCNLLSAGGLTQLGGNYALQVKEDNSEFMVNSVTGSDDALYGFPVQDNVWFLYYNKDVFTEEDVKSLDTMLLKGKVCLPLTVGWTSGTFFLGCGGTVFGEKGNDASAGIQFGEKNGGYIAARKMVELVNHPNVVCGGMDVGRLIDGEVDAAFSGTWEYQNAYKKLGDKLGIAMLPTFVAEGETYQMKCLTGSKCIGVNATTTLLDPLKQQIALEFAAYLASPEAQLARYAMTGEIPVSVSLREHELIRDNALATVILNTITYASVVQSALPEMACYWEPMTNFGYQIVSGEIIMQNCEVYVDEMVASMNSGWW